MGSECYPRDYYDLWYSRARARNVRRAGVEESQDTIDARKNENKRTNNLNYISKDLRIALEKNYALISGINFGAHLLLRAADDTKSLEQPRRSLESGPSRPDTEVEYSVIQARLRRASDLAKILADTLKQISQAILRDSIDLAIPSQGPTVQEPTVFYRVCHETSYTSHDADVGFWSAMGLPNHDFREPLESQFRAHLGCGHQCADPDNEHKEITFKSPYISLTTDPGRALNIGHGHKRNGLQLDVYQIDATKLRKMKIVIESTTDIKRTHSITDYIKYVTDSHWLANFWVPAECIIGKLDFSKFEALCKKNKIIYDGETYEATLGKDLPTGDFKRECESLQPSPPPPIPVKFVSDYDDETTPSVTPRRRKARRSNPTNVNDDKVGEASTPVQNTATADLGLGQRPKPPTPRPALRPVAPRSNPTNVNDGKGGETSTLVQNTARADSGLDQRPKPPTPRPALRPVAPRSNPTAVNDDKSGEASTPPQNTAPADSELEQRLQALSVTDT